MLGIERRNYGAFWSDGASARTFPTRGTTVVTRFETHEDCPACRQPMRVRELSDQQGGLFREELCATCDHYDIWEIEPEREEEEACLA